MGSVLQSSRRRETVWDEHQAITQAIAAGDAKRAVRLIDHHSQQARSNLTARVAGRDHKWLPHFCESTPETVWSNYGLTPEQATRDGLNPKMFNSSLDGSKPSIESTAVTCSTAKAATPSGASCCRPTRRCRWARCRSAWRIT